MGSLWAFADKAYDPALSRTHTDTCADTQTQIHTCAKVGHSHCLTRRVTSVSSLGACGAAAGENKNKT